MKWWAAGIGITVASYGAYAATAWLRYGYPQPANGEVDELLDRFMAKYEVVDRHKIRIAAPTEVALNAAAAIDINDSRLIRAIFKARELILLSKPDNPIRPLGLVDQMHSLGWGTLAELPGRELVMGGVTKPWEANPVFRAVPPESFATFHEPGYVKIIWTLRADPTGNDGCVFRTETRAVTTDAESRRKFRRYWSFLSPGIILIRRTMLPIVKRQAERRWQSPLREICVPSVFSQSTRH
jgi:hypothetical protein